MNRRIWTGVVAGVLAAAVLLMVGIGGYRAGQDDEMVTRVVSDGEPGRATEVVRVVGDHHGFGPGPFFFLFPLLAIVLIVLLVRRASGHGWRHGWGPGGPGGPGWHGRGPGYGPGYGPGGGPGWFDEWHRRAHEEERSQAPAASAPPASSAPSAGPEADTTPSGDRPAPPPSSA